MASIGRLRSWIHPTFISDSSDIQLGDFLFRQWWMAKMNAGFNR